VAGTNAPVSASGAFGSASSAILLGDTAASSTGSASLLTGGAFSVDRDITVQALGASGTQTATIGGSTADSSIFSGAISLNRNLTVTAVSGGTVNLTKSITNSTGSNTVNITGTSTSNVVLNNSGTSNQFAPTLFSINSGKLSLGASNQIGSATNVTVKGGGTFSSGGFSDGTRPSNAGGSDGAAGMGALTLLTTSSGSHATIDFTTGSGSSLVFSTISGASGAYIDVLNWNGLARTDNGLGTNDRLLIAGSDPGLTTTDLQNWQFYDNTGALFATGAMEIAYGNMFEIVPVPEPSTWVAAVLAFGVVGYSQRRRLRQLLARS
jgi:hypothetical protein